MPASLGISPALLTDESAPAGPPWCGRSPSVTAGRSPTARCDGGRPASRRHCRWRAVRLRAFFDTLTPSSTRARVASLMGRPDPRDVLLRLFLCFDVAKKPTRTRFGALSVSRVCAAALLGFGHSHETTKGNPLDLLGNLFASYRHRGLRSLALPRNRSSTPLAYRPSGCRSMVAQTGIAPRFRFCGPRGKTSGT